MKLPDNENIIIFFKRYGLSVLIAFLGGVFALFIIKGFINSILSVNMIRKSDCIIREEGQSVIYKDKTYKIDEIYEWSFGKIQVDLK